MTANSPLERGDPRVSLQPISSAFSAVRIFWVGLRFVARALAQALISAMKAR